MGLMRKAEEAVKGHHNESTHSANHGPHNSNVANKLDPRIDSDRGTILYFQFDWTLGLTAYL